MSWSAVLGKVRPQALWSSLVRPGCSSVARHRGGGLGAAVGGGSSSRQGPCDALGQQQQQCRGMAANNHRHKKILKLAKGYRGRSKSVFKIAIQRVEKALQQAYRDRKARKGLLNHREFRRLWIERINAGVRQHGMPYSVFVNKARKADVELNRKVLAEMAVTEPYSFRAVVETVKAKGSPKA
ncbi:unnamed protein product [Ectocarpus sp. 6 AP-2014]